MLACEEHRPLLVFLAPRQQSTHRTVVATTAFLTCANDMMPWKITVCDLTPADGRGLARVLRHCALLREVCISCTHPPLSEHVPVYANS